MEWGNVNGGHFIHCHINITHISIITLSLPHSRIIAFPHYLIFAAKQISMSPTQVTFLTFGILLLLALIFDLGILSKKDTAVSIKKALWQTLFWVGLSMAFCVFLWFEKSPLVATKYFTAYLMEWSLSVDNIFVFILIFTYFKVEVNDTARALLIGILLAIVFRIIFIAIGIQLIEKFHWILYVFGIFLLYTGFKFATAYFGVALIYSFISRIGFTGIY